MSCSQVDPLQDDGDEVQLISSRQTTSRKRKQSQAAAVDLENEVGLVRELQSLEHCSAWPPKLVSEGCLKLLQAPVPASAKPAGAEAEGPGVLSKLESDLVCC